LQNKISIEEESSIKDFVKEGFYETLLMNANVWITFMNPAGSIEVWNRAAEEISGYTGDEVTGSNAIWKKLYPEQEYRAGVTKKINSIIANRKKLENFETTIVTKEGIKKYISWNTREILDENREVAGFVAMGRDITEIVALGKQFRTLLMNTNVWVAFIDSGARVQIWNTAAEEISGYSKEEVTGTNAIWKKLYPEKDYRTEVTGKIVATLSGEKKLAGFESRIRTKSGSHRIISWNTKGIADDTGGIAGYIVVGIDVTKEKEMQEKIFGFIAESAMRLKNPVELIRDNLYDLVTRVDSKDIAFDDLLLQLNIQMKNADQIIENLHELNKAITQSFEEMPPVMKKFLSE